MFNKSSTPEQRLGEWRALRSHDYASPESIVEKFIEVSVVNRYLDFYMPNTWPNVFDIVADGIICPTGLTLIIAGTLCDKDFIKSDKLSFPVISSNISNMTGAVLEHEGQVYNFLPGEVVSLEYMRENSIEYNHHIMDVERLFK